MRRGKVQTTLRWAAAFVNMTLHSCSPARATDLPAPGVVVAIPGGGDHAPAAPRFYVASGVTDTRTARPRLRIAGPAPVERWHSPVLFEVIALKHSWDDRHETILPR